MQRVRFVIREGSVEHFVQRNDVEKIGDSRDFVNPHRVRVVDHDLELAVHLRELAQERRILRLDVTGGDAARPGARLPRLFLDDALDVHDAGRAGNRNRARLTEFETVPFARIVAGGDHHAAVRLQRAVGEVALRRRAHADIDHVGALRGHPRRQRFEQRHRMRAHIAADHHLFRAGEFDIGATDRLGHRDIEVGRIDSADIVSFENFRHEIGLLVFLVYRLVISFINFSFHPRKGG
ncbi:hypothetical protein SDC9_128717 [bioreactor metagenome]|uniref:Uncharacterized protein n=1 Tax=bioreactor metagenome TaxID=1076179 RepID=A0A645CWX0_9ZZZZ